MGPVIWVEGGVGVGKTTLSKLIAAEFNLRLFLEPVDSNPYLAKFYKDPKRWAFPMQIHLMGNRFAMQQAAVLEALMGNGAVLDRGLPGDRVFGKMHVEAGNIDPMEWDTYQQWYDLMSCTLRPPSLILYLDADPEVALRRVRKRGRPAESGMTLGYLQDLRSGYLDLMVDIESGRHAWAQGMSVLRWGYNTDDQNVGPIMEELRRRLGL